MKVEETYKYLGETFNSKGNNVALCKHRVDKSVGSIIAIISLETNFGKHQIFSMMVMYQSVFLPRLIYNCESWSNLTHKDINHQGAQLNFLRPVMEVPKSTPTAALFLELCILPIQYEIEKRQLVFLKKIQDRQRDDPVKMIYHEMLKYQAEGNWRNNVHELRSKHNLPLSDENVCNITYDTWERIVNDRIKHVAFLSLTEMCSILIKRHAFYHIVNR